MSYEYDQLLKRYGVSTDELPYGGTPMPTDSKDPAYQALLDKYNTDNSSYQDWLAEYRRRIAAFDMYGPGYQGEQLGAPTYLPREELKAPVAQTVAPQSVATAAPTPLEQLVVNEGGNYDGSANTNPDSPRDLTSMDIYGAPTTWGWDFDKATQSVKDNPMSYASLALTAPIGAIAKFGWSGVTEDLPNAVPGSIMAERAAGLTAEANAANQSFSDLSAADRASISNAADPIGALSDALGMGGNSDTGNDSSGGSAAGTNGSTGNDTDHGDGSAFRRGGLVSQYHKYSGGGLAIGGGQNLSPELQAAIRADAEANGITNPTTNFQGGQSYGYQPTPQQQAPSEAATLLELTSKYARPVQPERTTDYAADLQEARQAASRETDAFNSLVKQAMEQKSEGPSRAEMYFKLAAAFGAPTKTGAFGESLGNAAGVMAEHKRDMRSAEAANAARKLELEMTSQKARMDAAKTDLSTLRQLASKEMDSQRTEAMELMKMQLQTGKPQSEAGKIAMDQGLQPGTPAYSKFVSDYVNDKIESGKLFKEAMISVAQQGTNIRQSAEDRKLKEMGMLTPIEGKAIAAEQTALDAKAMLARNLELAFQLNKKAMSGSGISRATGAVLGAVGYPSERLKAEEELTQNLTQASLDYASRLKPMSDADARLAQKLTGLQGSSPASRAAQIEALYRQAKAEIAQHEARINDVRSRKNRTKIEAPTTPEGAE